MGITGPSLYNAFGNKRTLFVQALERYGDHSMRRLNEHLERDHEPDYVKTQPEGPKFKKDFWQPEVTR